MKKEGKKEKEIRTKGFKPGNFTGGNLQISFEKPEIKTKKEKEKEEEARKKETGIKEYYEEKKKAGVPVTGLPTPESETDTRNRY
ncbi:MAG: hypothetical protein Q8N37_00140 [bacterium]|nr:hypothetical protein [bacterium]